MIVREMVSAVHGLLKRGIMDKSIVSANFFLVPARIGLNDGLLHHFSPK